MPTRAFPATAEASRPDYGCTGFGDVENYLNEWHGHEGHCQVNWLGMKGIVKLTGCRLISAFLYEAKPLKLSKNSHRQFTDISG